GSVVGGWGGVCGGGECRCGGGGRVVAAGRGGGR
ncbi:TIGR04222 domain-containing membrane protein, partial [Achromobacter ruhlandii]|nr:TIGR04222 domain-containing membrane protein [Achromobacter ruhlandii]